MISLDAARSLLLADVPLLGSESVAIGAAAGRVLAEDVIATFDQPALPMSAMDGFATTADDARPGSRLRLIGEAYAGAPFAGRVARGEAVRIATGGVVPPGAEHVVMQEICSRDGEFVTIDGPMHDAHFVRPAGGDFAAGETLLEAGQELTPARLGLAAAANVASLAVRRQPRVAVFASGDELREPGMPLSPGAAVDSAGPVLAALVEQWGGLARRSCVLPDDHDRAHDLVGQAEPADVMLFIGGASVGDRDVLRAVVARLGADVRFDRIAVQPGKPSWHARFADGRMVLGLPGNPASAFVCAHLLLEPLMAAMLGRESRCCLRPARLAVSPGGGSERETYWRARLDVDAAGQAIVTPDARRDSSLQRPLAEANALLRQPAGAALHAGDVVEVIPL
jgi:molybdopterin molybdotransferase